VKPHSPTGNLKLSTFQDLSDARLRLYQRRSFAAKSEVFAVFEALPFFVHKLQRVANFSERLHNFSQTERNIAIFTDGNSFLRGEDE